MEIVVVGAGIGGLSAACALAKEGHRVTLVERAPAFEAVGAGIVLAPNAVQVMSTFGAELAGEGQVLAATDIRSDTGRLVNRLDVRALAAIHGPSYGITRARVHAILAAALPGGVDVVLGHGVDGIEEQADGVVVRWGSGSRRADLVVGADGLRSAVRAQVAGQVVPLRYSGTTCWRGIADLDAGDTAVEAWGHATRVGVVPVGGGRSYYYLVSTAPAGAPQPDWPGGFRTLFGGYRGIAGDLVSALADVPPLHHDLFELDRPVWGTPRVLLLGDAAHGMTPNQGQGAAMAIEDAGALALALRPGADGALDRYVAARHRRVRQVQLTSRRIGNVAHWENPVAVRVRDTVIRLTPPAAGARALRSLVEPGVRLAAVAGRSA